MKRADDNTVKLLSKAAGTWKQHMKGKKGIHKNVCNSLRTER